MRHPAPIIILSLSILMGLQGCAITPPKPWSPHITEEVRAKIRTLDIAVSEELPRITLELPSKGAGSGAGRKSGKWAGNWAKSAAGVVVAGVASGNGVILAVPLAAAMLALTPAVAAVGAAKGAIEAPSTESVESQETQVQMALQSGHLIRQLENELLNQAKDRTDLSATLSPKKTDDRLTHREEAITPVVADRTLRVQLQSINLLGPFDVDPPLELHFKIQVTLTDFPDATPQYTRSFHYVTGARRLGEWTANDGKHFREAVDQSLARLAELIIDDLFLTYPFAHEQPKAKYGS